MTIRQVKLITWLCSLSRSSLTAKCPHNRANYSGTTYRIAINVLSTARHTPEKTKHSAASSKNRFSMPTRINAVHTEETIETRLWLDEHEWLYAVLKSDQNISPTFRFPDLISACVSVVFAKDDASDHIFQFLGTRLVLRLPQSPRRRESMWMSQYNLLLMLQRSPANRHPNPKFQLDQLTTACVALAREADESGANVLQQARVNMAQRAAKKKEAQPVG